MLHCSGQWPPANSDPPSMSWSCWRPAWPPRSCLLARCLDLNWSHLIHWTQVVILPASFCTLPPPCSAIAAVARCPCSLSSQITSPRSSAIPLCFDSSHPSILNPFQFPSWLSSSPEPAEMPPQPRHRGQPSSVLLHHRRAAWRSRGEPLMLPNSLSHRQRTSTGRKSGFLWRPRL